MVTLLYWEWWQTSHVIAKVSRKEVPVCGAALIRFKTTLVGYCDC